MGQYFQKVKNYLLELQLQVSKEDPKEEILIVTDESNGIHNLILDCEEPLLVLEQVIMPVPSNPDNFFKRLLQINRELIHGAFALDDEGKAVLFRDTLELTNLDLNELEGSINALSLAMAEYASEFLEYSKG